MNDYERVARLVHFLGENYRQQPDLADIAAVAGLSPSRVHRLFSQLVGVTPKDFVQGLTADLAKFLLRDGASVLDAALDAGLSGPGRLHDLCVSLEAASPGEWKHGGRDLVLRHGFAFSPFGRCLVAETDRGLCHLSFAEAGEDRTALRHSWPAARFQRDDQRAEDLVRAIFAPDPPIPTLRAFVRASRFQHRVWRALLAIPPGSLASYGQIAAAIGHPGAGRAVGRAVGANPLAILIPCHRIIRQTGQIGAYHWGVERKRCLLARELGAVRACQGESLCGSVPPKP